MHIDIGVEARSDELDGRRRARVVCGEGERERVRQALIWSALSACYGCRPVNSTTRNTTLRQICLGERVPKNTGEMPGADPEHWTESVKEGLGDTVRWCGCKGGGRHQMHTHQLSMLSESGKAEMPSSEFIMRAMSSFCRRLHALPVSEFEAAPTTAAIAIRSFVV